MQINNTRLLFTGIHKERKPANAQREKVFTNDKEILDALTQKIEKSKMTKPEKTVTSDLTNLSCTVGDKITISAKMGRTANDTKNTLNVSFTDKTQTEHELVFDVTAQTSKQDKKELKEFLNVLSTSITEAKAKIQEDINKRALNVLKNLK